MLTYDIVPSLKYYFHLTALLMACYLEIQIVSALHVLYCVCKAQIYSVYVNTNNYTRHMLLGNYNIFFHMSLKVAILPTYQGV